jgi:hypothetical protein
MRIRWPGLKALFGIDASSVGRRPPVITHARFSVFPPDGRHRVYAIQPFGERWVGRPIPPKRVLDRDSPVLLQWSCDAVADTATRMRITLAEDRRTVTMQAQEAAGFYIEPDHDRIRVLYRFDAFEEPLPIRWTYNDWDGVVQLELFQDGAIPYSPMVPRCSGIDEATCFLPKGHDGLCRPCRPVERDGAAPAPSGGFRDAAGSPDGPLDPTAGLKADIVHLERRLKEAHGYQQTLKNAAAAYREAMAEKHWDRTVLIEALSDVLTGNYEPQTVEGAMMRAKTALDRSKSPRLIAYTPVYALFPGKEPVWALGTLLSVDANGLAEVKREGDGFPHHIPVAFIARAPKTTKELT